MRVAEDKEGAVWALEICDVAWFKWEAKSGRWTFPLLLTGFDSVWWSQLSPRCIQPGHTLRWEDGDHTRGRLGKHGEQEQFHNICKRWGETFVVLTALVRCLTSCTLQRESGRVGRYSSLSLTEGGRESERTMVWIYMLSILLFDKQTHKHF